MGIEKGQRTGDNAIVTVTLPQLGQIVFQHLDGLIDLSLFASVGGKVEDIVIRVVWRNLEYLLPIVLHTVNIGREEWGEVGHLRSKQVQFALLFIVVDFVCCADVLYPDLVQQQSGIVEDARYRKDMSHSDGTGGKAVCMAKRTLALNVLIDIIVGRVEIVGHILIVDAFVELKELVFIQSFLESVFKCLQSDFLLCQQFTPVFDKAVDGVVKPVDICLLSIYGLQRDSNEKADKI